MKTVSERLAELEQKQQQAAQQRGMLEQQLAMLMNAEAQIAGAIALCHDILRDEAAAKQEAEQQEVAPETPKSEKEIN